MKIVIKRNGNGRVRVLPELNVSRVSVLEGLNGIGKSASIRLLQVCTGTKPYASNNRAWNSLVAEVGPTEVRILGIDGANEVVWTFDTTTWPAVPVHVEDNWFESITIDGQVSTLADIRQLITVHRFAGDVNVVDSLAEQVDYYFEIVESARAEFESSPSRTSAAVAASDTLNSVIELIETVDVSGVVDNELAIASGGTLVEKLRAENLQLKVQLESAEVAQELAQRIRQIDEIGPTIEVQFSRVDGELKDAQVRRETVYKSLESAAVVAEENKAALNGLASAERRLARNQKKLEEHLVELAGVLEGLSLTDDAPAIDLAREADIRELTELVELQKSLDAGPYVFALVSDLITRLNVATTSGLGQERILSSETELSSVSGLKTGLEGRQIEITLEDPLPEAASLIRDIDEKANRLALFDRIPEIRTEVERYSRLADQAREDIEAATNASVDVSEEISALRIERDQLDTTILRLATERARLGRQKGFFGEVERSTLEAQFTQRLAQCGVDLPAELDQHVADLGVLLSNVESRLIEAGTRLEKDRVQLENSRRQVAQISEEIASAESFGWLREALPELTNIGASDLGNPLTRLGEISKRCGDALERLDRSPNQLAGVSRALQHLAGKLRGREVGASLYVASLSAWFEDQFTHYFNHQQVRDELLPGATHIRMHLDDVSLKWLENGVPESKALEAFSSGEQAFAFTRARLGLLDVEGDRARNRLICLDEFGAFMAENRKQKLFDYLADRAAAHPEDHVLLILPVRQDYEHAAVTAIDEERSELLRRANDIETVGVTFEEIVA